MDDASDAVVVTTMTAAGCQTSCQAARSGRALSSASKRHRWRSPTSAGGQRGQGGLLAVVALEAGPKRRESLPVSVAKPAVSLAGPGSSTAAHVRPVLASRGPRRRSSGARARRRGPARRRPRGVPWRRARTAGVRSGRRRARPWPTARPGGRLRQLGGLPQRRSPGLSSRTRGHGRVPGGSGGGHQRPY